MTTKKLSFTIRYTGGSADENTLNLYDAGISLQGLSRALSISAEALVTKGKAVRKRATSTTNVKTFVQPSKRGSFIETVTIIFEEPAVSAIGISVIASAFWAMLEYSWKIASGQEATTDNRLVQKIFRENESLDVQLSDVLEKPIRQIHRPIKDGNEMEIEVYRPRKGSLLKFNSNTKEYVSTIVEAGIQENIKCNVTKYNIITGYGRLFVDDLNKTIAFNIDREELSVLQEDIIKESIFNASATNYEGAKILIDAEVKKDRQGNTLRYKIVRARKIHENNTQQLA